MMPIAAASTNVLVLPVVNSRPKQDEPKKRKSGLTKRKDGRFQVSVSYHLPNGELKRKTFYGKTQAAVKAKRDAFRRDEVAGLDIRWYNQPYKDYIERWLAIRKSMLNDRTRIIPDCEPNSIKQYRTYAELPQTIIGNKRLRDVHQTDLQLCVSKLTDKSTSYLSKVSFVLNSIFESAQGDRIITFNPMDNVKFPKGTAGTHRALEPDEVDRVRYSHTNHPMWLPVMIMLYAGLRRGELIGLHTDNIDLENKVIHVRQAVSYPTNQPVLGLPKTEAGIRDIPICPILQDAIKDSKFNPGYVIGGGKAPVTETKFRRMWNSYIFTHEKDLNGLRTNTPTQEQLENWKAFSIRSHDLRHTFCTFLYDAEVDVKTAQVWMGHANIKVTMAIYTHLSERRKTKSVDAFNRFLSA